MPRATAHIEILTMIVRVFNLVPGESARSYGDPYDWAATVKTHGPDTIEFLGVTNPLTKDQLRALHREFHRLGFRWYVERKMVGDVEKLSEPRRIKA